MKKNYNTPFVSNHLRFSKSKTRLKPTPRRQRSQRGGWWLAYVDRRALVGSKIFSCPFPFRSMIQFWVYNNVWDGLKQHVCLRLFEDMHIQLYKYYI
jgi:hypothetical protein